MRLFQTTFAISFLLATVAISLDSDTLFSQGFRARPTAARASAPVISQNFIVRAEDPILARKVSAEAERFRKELAIEWLGHELPNWRQKCPITVELKMHAGGETSFAFVPDRTGKGTPIDWRMKLFGPANRILDAVLPHEVTHTIFATHFGQPLPRWADEGACTTVEHESERKKNHQMLMEFLSSSPSRGLPFNRMFTMRNYPHDILPLYAQGYSLAKFLILQKGKRHFVDYVGKGLRNESNSHALTAWNRATDESYNYKNLSDLQIAWLDWVRKGSDETAFKSQTPPATFVSNPAKTVRGENSLTNSKLSNSSESRVAKRSLESTGGPDRTFANDQSESWYAQQMRSKGRRNEGPTERVAAKRENLPPLTRSPVEPAENYRDSRLPSEFRTAPQTIWR